MDRPKAHLYRSRSISTRGEKGKQRVWQRLYSDYHAWRARAYDAILTHQLPYDALESLAGDLRDALKRVEDEMLFQKPPNRKDGP